MASGFLQLLPQFFFSPIGLVAIGVGAVLLAVAVRRRAVAWFLLSLCMFAASLSKFQNEWILDPPALVFPLQQLREMGRPLAVLLLGAVLVVGWRTRVQGHISLPYAIRWLIVVQAVIFLKTVIYGSITFALLAVVVFGVVILMIWLGPLRWLQEPGNFHLSIQAIATVALIFVVVNGYQMAFDVYPLTFVHDRFLGTTGNPQAAGLLLAGTIPSIIFLTEKAKQRWQRSGWTMVLLVVLGLLLWSGSRTGILMGAFTSLFFYRYRFWRLLRLGLVVGIVGGLLLALIADQNSLLWQSTLDQMSQRFLVSPAELAEANSRQVVWAALWRNFLQNPVLGVPLAGERLMGYGESSWLGTAAALGLAGLTPLILFGMTTLHMILRLIQTGRREPRIFFESSVVVAGLASLLIGSFFEAYLLGNITPTILFLFIYLSLGQAVLEQPEILAIQDGQYEHVYYGVDHLSPAWQSHNSLS